MKEKNYVCIILGLVSVILVLVYGLAWLLPEEFYQDPHYYAYWRAQKDYVMHDDDKEEVLLLGDSCIQSGILALELSDDAYNLALAGSSPVEMYYTLKIYLVHHPRPKVVFLAFSPEHYRKYDSYLSFAQKYHYFDSSTINEINQVIKENGGPDYTKDTFSYRYRLPDVYMKSIFRSIMSPQHQENMKLYEKSKEHKGRLFFPDKTVGAGNFSEKKSFLFIRADYLNFYMEKLIQLCCEENIPIYLEQMPMENSVYQNLMEWGYIAKYEYYMKGLRDKYNIFVNCQIPVYPEEYFCDELHLNEKGAKKFTKEFRDKYHFIFNGK